MTVISVIVGSTRQGRFSESPRTGFFSSSCVECGIEARLLDLRDFPMPFFDQQVLPPCQAERPTSMRS